MNNQISSAGLELANSLVTSPLHQSWDAVQKQKLQTADDLNAQMALYISETKHLNTTIISFLTSRVKSQIAADINLVTCSYCPSTENPSGGSCSNYPSVEIGLGATKVAITHLFNDVAHESAGADGAKGQRAMLVCRVSAGQVSKQLDLERY
ncbi:hypothetical protein COP1_041946 [Malus domestica]